MATVARFKVPDSMVTSKKDTVNGWEILQEKRDTLRISDKSRVPEQRIAQPVFKGWAVLCYVLNRLSNLNSHQRGEMSYASGNKNLNTPWSYRVIDWRTGRASPDNKGGSFVYRSANMLSGTVNVKLGILIV
jgi:hypothetical protein